MSSRYNAGKSLSDHRRPKLFFRARPPKREILLPRFPSDTIKNGWPAEKMAKRVALLLAKTTELGNEFIAVMPATYRNRPIVDPVCEAWNEGLTHLADAYQAIDRLPGLLQAKAPTPPATLYNAQHPQQPTQSAAELLRAYQELA